MIVKEKYFELKGVKVDLKGGYDMLQNYKNKIHQNENWKDDMFQLRSKERIRDTGLSNRTPLK